MTPKGDSSGSGKVQLQTSEARLAEIRREGERRGVTGSPVPERLSAAMANVSYYGLPVLKAPPWKWEIPAYFFVGGAAGAAAVIGAAASFWRNNPRLARDAQRLAALGGTLSPALLISDLGVPSRFLNMLRVFKVQSPMSLGSWTLMCFSSSAAAAAFLNQFPFRDGAARVLASASQTVSAFSGLVLSSYTGVLLGATAIPVW